MMLNIGKISKCIYNLHNKWLWLWWELESNHFSCCQGPLLNTASYSRVGKIQVFGESWRPNAIQPPVFVGVEHALLFASIWHRGGERTQVQMPWARFPAIWCWGQSLTGSTSLDLIFPICEIRGSNQLFLLESLWLKKFWLWICVSEVCLWLQLWILFFLFLFFFSCNQQGEVLLIIQHAGAVWSYKSRAAPNNQRLGFYWGWNMGAQENLHVLHRF